MSHKWMIGAAALLLLTPGAAWAGQGKAGLWKTVSTVDMAMAMPPDIAAQMKKSGIKPPAPKTQVSQMCMTQAEVDASTPPHIDREATGCDTRVVGQTGSSMKAKMTCTGKVMQGTGDMQIAYTGNTRYAGTYSFKGTVQGNPTSMTTKFSGEWLKADCGNVKPYQLRTQ